MPMAITGWKASRLVQIKASGEQVKRWIREAARRSMTLSAWIRMVCDDVAPPKEGEKQ